MSIEPKKPGDEIIEIPAVPDAELQCIHCVGQVLELFFPSDNPESDESIQSVLGFLSSRWGGGPFGPRRTRMIGGAPTGIPPGFADEMKATFKAALRAQREVDREEIIPPDPDAPNEDDPKKPKA